ncbi:MAG: glycosyltransferase [Microbacterium sp.]|nr:glycosyltransferase [Microbacterium sp.]
MIAVTVLMAEYNTSPENLRTSIGSMLRQTFTDFEFLIVDDGSATDVRRIASEFDDPRLSVISYGSDRENRGFAAALNHGLSAANGEFIARIDPDDWVSPEYLATLHAFMTDHPEYAVASACAVEFSSSMPAIQIGRDGEKTSRDVMRGSAPIHAASMMRRSDIETVGGYPDRHRAEDLALWCELLLAGRRLYVIPAVLYHYRVEAQDLRKRRLGNRGGELAVRIHYYRRLGAGPLEYLRILRSVLSGVLPQRAVRGARYILWRSRSRLRDAQLLRGAPRKDETVHPGDEVRERQGGVDQP